MQDLIFESDDVMEFKIVPTFVTGGHFNHAKAAFIIYYLGGEDFLGDTKIFRTKLGGLEIFN